MTNPNQMRDVLLFVCSKMADETSPLRKHAYSNILRILPPKNENFQIKKTQWGGSNENPQSMFLSRNKKINVYPCKPQFYCIKVGFKGIKSI